MRTLVFALLFAFVIGSKEPLKDFVTSCCEGNINIGAELFTRISESVPKFTTNIISECDSIFTNIIQKQPNILDETKMLRLRYILNTYLKECIEINLNMGTTMPAQMYSIDKEYKCTYSGYKEDTFGDMLNSKEYKNIINYNNLSKPTGLLSRLLTAVINLIVTLLQSEGNLLNGLLGQVLGLKSCIQSVIGVADTLVRGVYVSLEKGLVTELGEYLGPVSCPKVDPSFMIAPCNKINKRMYSLVNNFYNETVHHVYRCMHMKYLQLEHLSLHKIMNMY